MSEHNQFVPDYAVLPGETLQEELESRDMTQVELADRTGMAKKTINEIIKGKAPITPETALKLERVFGLPAHFWNNLEQNYQEAKARLIEQVQLKQDLAWLKRVPTAAMIKLGWVRRCNDKIEQLEAVLSFFGIASVSVWQTVWERHQVAYRQSKRFMSHTEAVSAWLRRGELEGQQIECAPYNESRFRSVLKEARSLSRERPQVFIPQLVALCASAGVAVVFVPELPHTYVSGVTRWLGKDKALIQLSFRYKSDDHFWFTFFHEAGHILKHGKQVFLEMNGDGLDDELEKEADCFAQNELIPPAKLKAFLATANRSLAAITAFSDELNIAPGIVAGRLQHDGHLPHHQGNKLKQPIFTSSHMLDSQL